MRVIFWILILVLLCSFVNAISINEIMYDPNQCPDAYCEWIEIYNPSSELINLSNWKLCNNKLLAGYINNTDGKTYLENGLILQPDQYAIITDGGSGTLVYDNFGISEDSLAFHIDGSAMCTNGLGNNDILTIKDSEENIIDAVHYYPEWGAEGADGDGKSLCKLNNFWQECFSTPGFGDEDSCDWKIEVLFDDYIFYNGGDVNWNVRVSKNYGNNSNINITGYVKDLITGWQRDYSRKLTGNSNIPYTPNLWANRFYEIFFNIAELGCNDTNLEDNFDSKFIMVPPWTIGQDYTKVRINELFPNPQGDDNAQMPDGEWVELYNSGEEDLDLEGLELQDEYGSSTDLSVSDSNTLNGTIIKAGSYIVVYMNGRSGFLNNEGFEKIRLYKETFLIDEISYSGSTEGLSWGELGGTFTQTIPSPGASNYGNVSFDSNITLENIYDLGSDDIVKFGQVIRVKLNIFNAEENKKAIKSWIESEEGEKISKETKFETPEKFSEGAITVPIQLIPNCDRKFSDGEYKLIVSGLDERVEEDIEVEGITKELCEEVKIESKSMASSSESNLKNSITGNTIFEDKGLKQKRSALYFFCALMILIVVYYSYGKQQPFDKSNI